MSKANELLEQMDEAYKYDSSKINGETVNDAELAAGYLQDRRGFVKKIEKIVFKARQDFEDDFDSYVKKHKVLSKISFFPRDRYPERYHAFKRALHIVWKEIDKLLAYANK